MDRFVLDSNTVTQVVNLRTAKGLGLKIPQSVIARADELIQ